MFDMRRRQFITLLGGAAVSWPLAARGQQPAMPVVGYLSSRSPDDTAHLLAGFRQGLGNGGFLERQNVTIEYRWALGRYDRLPALATELARLPVSLVVSTGGEPAALAAKSATSTITIVFATGSDPVKAGLVASYNRPGGNATGFAPYDLAVLVEIAQLLDGVACSRERVGQSELGELADRRRLEVNADTQRRKFPDRVIDPDRDACLVQAERQTQPADSGADDDDVSGHLAAALQSLTASKVENSTL